MNKALRKTGVDIIGEVPWGAHFCLFYETKSDLFEILLPYFKAGLENNEFCMWIVSEPLSVGEAIEAMRRAVPNFSQYLEKGQIEVLPHAEGYLKEGEFNVQVILNDLIARLDQTLAKGYEGLRVAGCMFSGKEDWKKVLDFEEEVKEVIGRNRMIAICIYPIDKCGVNKVIDVGANHRFILIKKGAIWELIENIRLKRIEEALRESEEGLRLITDSLPVLICYVDSEQCYRFVNKAYEDWYGLPRGEIYGQHVKEILSESAYETIQGYVEAVLSGQQISYEAWIPYKSGSIRYVSAIYVPDFDKRGKVKGFFALLTDITEKKNVEEQLMKHREYLEELVEERTAKFKTANEQLQQEIIERKRAQEGLLRREKEIRMIADNVPALFSFVDTKGCYRFVNKQYEEWFGLPQKEIIGKHYRQIVGEPTYELIKHHVETVLSGHRVHYEEILPYVSGGTRWVDSEYVPNFDRQGNVRGFYALVTDITKRKQTEEELKATKALLENIFESLDDAIFVIDPFSRFVIACNSALKRIFGYETQEVTGKSTELLHVDRAHFDKFGEEVDLALKRNGRYQNEYVMRRKDGEIFTTENTVTIIRDASGVWKGSVSVVRDITERKRIEEALREREASYRELADSISDIFFAMDRDFKYTYWNKASEKLTGISAQDAIGKSLYDLFQNIGGTKIEELYSKTLRTHQPQSFESAYRVGTKDFIFEINAYPSQHGLSVFVKDITERKRTEEALKESKEFTESLIASMQDGLSVLDRHGCHIDVNPAFHQMTGFSKEELIGVVPPHPYWPPEAYEEIERAFKKTLRGEFSNFELTFMRKNGQRFPVIVSPSWVKDNQGNVISYFTTVKDITQGKRAEEALRESEKRYRILFETSPDAIAVMDLNLNIITVNQPALMLFGYESLEEVVGKNALEFVAMNDRSRAAEDASKLLRTERGKTSEYSIQVKDRALVPAELRASVIRDTDGKAKSFIVVIRDIGERKASEEKIRVYEEQLRSLASELTLLEERERRRIANDLHDHIGQTLALSKIKLGELRESVSPSLVKPLGEIYELIEQTIQYTRSLTFELSPPILYELGFEAAVECLAEQIQEKHGISVDFEDDLQPKPIGKEMRILLFKAVGELLMNIIKHAQAHKAKVAIQREDSNIRITVEDDGIGFYIPEANQLAGVRGYGLFSIRERLKHLGGSLQIQSGHRGGTLITLLAPIKQKEN